MKAIQFIILLVLFGANISVNNASAETEAALKQKSILITGASTGIGRNLAETLASKGHHVYAGARKDKDIAALNAIKNITAVRLDVTKQAEIDALVALIKQKGTGLYGLVNNAGIYIGGLISNADIEDHNKLYNINVEGVYRVTKAFIPLIIESQGRIASTGSIAGTLTRDDMSAYSGSKHWVEAITDALAAEMLSHNVSVSVIEPGNYQTNIRRSSMLREFAKIEAAGGEVTAEMQQAFQKMSAYELSLKKPDEVSAAYMHALFDERPLRRYVVTPNKGEQAATITTKVRQLVELNQWGPYSYSRDELVALLDKAIAAKTMSDKKQ